MTSKQVLFYSLLSAMLAIGMYAIHNGLVKNYNYIIDLKKIYSFLFFSNLVVYLSVFYVSKKIFDKVGFTFMGISVLKILASIIFLWVLFNPSLKDPLKDIVNFFVPYFVFLILEIIFSLRVLNQEK